MGGLAALIYTADAEFVAGALSRVLGRHVEIGSISFRPGASLEVEFANLRVTDSAQPDQAPLLEVERAIGRQAWPRLLAGQFLPLDWVLERPVLRLRAAGAAGGPAFDLGRLPPVGLSVRDAEVTYTPASGDPYEIRGLHVEAKRAGFGRRIEGEASARVVRGKSALGEMSLRFSAGRSGGEARGSVVGLDLGFTPENPVRARGLASGSFDLAYEHDAGALRGKLDLDVAKLSLRVPTIARSIEPARARLAADVDWNGSVLELGLRPLTLDDLVATGSITLDTRTPGRIALDLRLGNFEPGRRDRLNPLTLLGMKIDTWRRVASQIEAGTVEDAHLVIDVPRTTAGARLSFDAPLAPRAFQLDLRARDGIYRPNPRTRLENMSGVLRIRGNVLEIHDLRLTDEGKPTPEIDVIIDGLDRLSNLPDDEDSVVGGPETELAGIGALVDGLADDRSEDAEPTVLSFSHLALRYPAFVLPLREGSGRLRFPRGGIESEGVRGVLGGAPAEIDVRWDPEADRVALRVRYLREQASGRPAEGPVWLSGRIALDRLNLGDLRASNLRADLDARAADVRFSSLTAALAGGSITGSGRMSLGEVGRAPYRFDLELRDFDAGPVATVFELPDQSVVGRGNAKGVVSGALRRGGRFATDGELELHLDLRNGSVAKLPGLVALARLPSLSGVSGLLGRPLPYDTLSADFKLADGRLEMADAKLLGSQLRMLGSGEMDLNTPTKESEFVVALLFLKTLDSVIGSLPIVRNVILGKDRNLLALYFSLDGPRDDMTVTPLPPERVRNAVGFASDAVMKGVRTLGNLIPTGDAPAEPDPAPSPTPP